MISNRTFGHVRQCITSAALIAAAAAIIGIGAAHADTPDDVLGQAITVINEGDAVSATAPTTDLGTVSAELLARQEDLSAGNSTLLQMASLQDMFSATDQTSLANADEQFVSAAQNVLSADQAFVAADQAGELSGNGLNSADLTVIDADFGLIGAEFNVGGDELLDLFTGGFGTSSAAEIASSLGPATAADPSIFADVLSSIGL